MERLGHSFHARTRGFGAKVERTQKIIADALALDAHFYCAFSSGVDSTVLLDMVYQVKACPVLYGDDGWDYPESLAFLRETEARYNFPLKRIRCIEPWRDWCHEMERPDLADDPAALEAWGNPHQWDAIWQSLKDAPQDGYTGVFLGLLASESRSRSYALRDGWKPLYQVKSEHGMWHCSPLASWNKQDVWSYIVSRNLSYNLAYDKLAAMDIPLVRRRVAPLTCFRVMQYGSVVALRVQWPDLYNRLAATFPRVRSYG